MVSFLGLVRVMIYLSLIATVAVAVVLTGSLLVGNLRGATVSTVMRILLVYAHLVVLLAIAVASGFLMSKLMVALLLFRLVDVVLVAWLVVIIGIWLVRVNFASIRVRLMVVGIMLVTVTRLAAVRIVLVTVA